MNSIVFPFLTAREHAPEVSPWEVRLNAAGAELLETPDFLPGWDNSTGIVLERSLETRIGSLLEELGIESEDVPIEMQLWLGTGGSRTPTSQRLGWRDLLAESLHVACNVPGEGLAGQLQLDLVMVLSRDLEDHETGSRLSPRHQGDLLWRDVHRIRLEGDAPQFPVTSQPLQGDMTDALWVLKTHLDDPRVPLEHAVRVVFNSNRPEFMQCLQKRDPVVMQALMSDVILRMVDALLEPLMHEEGDLPDDSAGAVVARWVRTIFGDFSRADILRMSDPDRFRAMIQAHARFPDNDS